MLTPLISAYAEFSEGEVDVFRELIRPDDWIVEVGANIGAHTLTLAELVPRGRVLAFEPQRLTFQLLCANLALNSVVNVYPERMLVGAECSTKLIHELDPHVSANFGNFHVDEADTGQLFTPIATIDALALPRLDFMKLDCEGAEAGVLAGAAETIDKYRPAVYLEFDQNREEVIQFFAPRRYDLARHWPHHARRATFGNVGYNVASDMVLAWPQGRPAGQRMVDGSFTRDIGFSPANAEQVLRMPK